MPNSLSKVKSDIDTPICIRIILNEDGIRILNDTNPRFEIIIASEEFGI